MAWTGGIGCVLALIVLATLIYMIAKSGGSQGIMITFLIITAIIAFIMGVLCILAAQNINRYAPQSDIGSSYKYAYIGAILGITVVSVTIIGAVVYAVFEARKKSEAKKQSLAVASALVKVRERQLESQLARLKS